MYDSLETVLHDAKGNSRPSGSITEAPEPQRGFNRTYFNNKDYSYLQLQNLNFPASTLRNEMNPRVSILSGSILKASPPWIEAAVITEPVVFDPPPRDSWVTAQEQIQIITRRFYWEKAFLVQQD